MQNIHLIEALPKVFEERRTSMKSDVWLQNLTLEKGKLYLVEAASGTGKSSLCSYIFGYRKDFSGQITFDGKDINTLKVHQWVELRKRSLSILWQELRLFPELTALENVQIKNKLTGYQTDKQIEEWFDMLGIADKLQAKIGRMSFGQQQRVAMIRALCQPFDFIFADEPVSHLDEGNSNIMGQIMMTEAKKQGAGVIVTSIGKHIDLNYERVLKL
ncbi:MAG: ATP-binding cassette domain-containing protein [Bacteroidaceae bacterium]|nr:ATP-binding cassette domain-containing protein [Bacteroidaceae bacterium]MDO4955612.1 ATP-binding cassette domain-containing protein [Bacteroidales bacterium]